MKVWLLLNEGMSSHAHSFQDRAHILYLSVEAESCRTNTTHQIHLSVLPGDKSLLMTEYTAFPLVKRLQNILLSDPPYCSGVLEVSPSNFELYYGRKDARYVVHSFVHVH